MRSEGTHQWLYRYPKQLAGSIYFSVFSYPIPVRHHSQQPTGYHTVLVGLLLPQVCVSVMMKFVLYRGKSEKIHGGQKLRQGRKKRGDACLRHRRFWTVCLKRGARPSNMSVRHCWRIRNIQKSWKEGEVKEGVLKRD